jgi:hypothetical protein
MKVIGKDPVPGVPSDILPLDGVIWVTVRAS